MPVGSSVEDPYHWDDRVDAWEEVAATPTFRALQQRILDVAEPAPDDVAVLGLALGPLRFTPRPWNAATFNEQLTGRITQLSGVSRGIVSLVGQGTGEQNVLVRADLLIAPRRLLRTAFQMEYLPSGELCTGKVTTVHPTGFGAVCRISTGAIRRVQAAWTVGEAAQLTGSIGATGP